VAVSLRHGIILVSPYLYNDEADILRLLELLTPDVMHLRRFRPSDLEILYAIDQACFPPGISYSREDLAGFIAGRNSRTWVAEESGEIVGFLIANRQPQKVGHIVTIDVVESERRQGIGSRLMCAVEEWARQQDLRLVYLETAEDNLPAQRFYQARGYRKAEKVERYYGDGRAAWVMMKWLER
jgi:ribosomal protein S18 acetylase RimI-like enzyme